MGKLHCQVASARQYVEASASKEVNGPVARRLDLGKGSI